MSAHIAPLAAEKASATVPTLGEVMAGGNLALKTCLQRSSEFKSRLASRQIDPLIVSAHCLLRMPRYVWVVEAIDRRWRSANQPPVLAQAIFDSTSDDIAPDCLGGDVHGFAFGVHTTGKPKDLVIGPPAPYKTGAP
ncbi:MAG: hypothetical protein JWO62_2317 [Acidimicrobiaceae bacterium]|jgi:hypothetical protein|nr:hypothetical protein [Acidimicrobiaceae bacterium]